MLLLRRARKNVKRNKDKLVHYPLSTIWRLSFIGGFCVNKLAATSRLDRTTQNALLDCCYMACQGIGHCCNTQTDSQLPLHYLVSSLPIVFTLSALSNNDWVVYKH